MSRPLLSIAILVPLAALLAVLGGCAASRARPEGVAPSAPEAPATATLPGKLEPKVTEAQNAFGFDLLKRLAADRPGENAFISPYSVATALAMTWNGATGATKDAMANTLHLDGLPPETVNSGQAALKNHLEDAGPKVEISIANALWVGLGERIKPDFLRRNRDYYGAQVTTLDFGQPAVAAKAINDWTSQKTRTRIPEIVTPADLRGPVPLVLTNAVHFNGKWKTPFDRKLSHDATFSRLDGTTLTVRMMSHTGMHDYLRGDGFQAVRLPYGDGRLSMIVFVPDFNDGLTALLKKLDAAHWAEWMKGLRPAEGGVQLPRFRLEYEVELDKTLKALGMGPAFRGGFTGISDDDMWISTVLHKTFVEVDEEGTEAAAATAVVMMRGAPAGYLVRADRSFLCAIRDERTGAILFLGAVTRPTGV